jgi:hypothetical protein
MTSQWASPVGGGIVLHRIKTAECLDSRLFWAMILWSWCGPDLSQDVSVKDELGSLCKDRNATLRKWIAENTVTGPGGKAEIPAASFGGEAA